ncbi:MAG: hypothetical protein QW808_03240, partial [Desulfurococcaceae archaeon]
GAREMAVPHPQKNPAPQGPGAGVSQAQPQAFSSPGAQGQAPISPIRAVYVGRHRLLPTQEAALRELNINVVRIIENLPNDIQQLRQLLRELRATADAIVTVALPINLLIEIKNAGFRVFVFRMSSGTVRDIAEAEAWVSQAPERRTYLPGRPGEPVRVMEFVGIDEITEIRIVSRQVWPA